MSARRIRSADSTRAASQTEHYTTAQRQTTERRMARIEDEAITVNTNSVELEAGLKAFCDGFNALKEMRKESTKLMREIRREMRKIEQAYAAVTKPKDDLPAEITALSVLTASL
jgi:chromosome segregation ATPase